MQPRRGIAARGASAPFGEDSPRAVGGLITEIAPQERHGGRRLNVFLDGAYAFSLGVELTARLEVGRALSAREATALQEEDRYQRALEHAFAFLSYRPRSEREVRDRLARRGHSPSLLDRVVVRLREIGLVDDAAFAEFWVGQRQAHNPRGEMLLRQELLRKGTDREAIGVALEVAETGEDAAVAAGRKKAAQLRGLDWREFQQRLGAHLARRGFTWDVVAPAVKRLWAQANGEDEPEDEVAEG
jgi:regulatory protein